MMIDTNFTAGLALGFVIGLVLNIYMYKRFTVTIEELNTLHNLRIGKVKRMYQDRINRLVKRLTHD